MVNLGDIKAFTVKEIAEQFNVNIATVRNYIKEGKLKAKKLGTKYFITEENLKEYLESDN